MTIINCPCFLFIYDPFNKKQLSDIMQIPAGTTMISNYQDVGMNCFVADTEQKCSDKITELVLTPLIEETI